jgi:hypothetical protein
MNNTNANDRCRKELEKFIADLEEESLPWYDKASKGNYFAWQICSLLTIIAVFASSLIAALLGEGAFKNYGKMLLVIVPAVGALAATLKTQFRFEARGHS